MESENDEEWIYLYCAMSERDGPRRYDPTKSSKILQTLEELIVMREKMRADLAETGLWNDEAFGIWTTIRFG